MSSAFRRSDIIDKSISIVTVGIIVLHRNLHGYVIHNPLTVDDILI